MRKRTYGHARPAKIQISLFFRAVWSKSSLGTFLDNQGCKVSWCGQRKRWSDCAEAQAHVTRNIRNGSISHLQPMKGSWGTHYTILNVMNCAFTVRTKVYFSTLRPIKKGWQNNQTRRRITLYHLLIAVWQKQTCSINIPVKQQLKDTTLIGPRHAKMDLRAFVDSKGPDKTAHPHNLIRAFAVRYQNHWILTIRIEIKVPDDSLRMRRMIYLNAHFANTKTTFCLTQPSWCRTQEKDPYAICG